MRILLLVLLILILTPSWTGEKRAALLGPDPAFTASPVAFDPTDPGRRRAGRLTWLGGVRLDSHDPAFGGFSAIRVVGDRFTLLSDAGNVVRFRMDRQWRVSDRSFGHLPAGPGTGWPKEDRDSESLTVDPGTGRVWVGFERANAIWRYGPDLERGEAHAAPAAMAGWPDNGGAEAMARLGDGGFVVIAETAPWRGAGPGRAAIRFAGDPAEHPDTGFGFGYLPPQGYDPSDLAVLPDGRLLVLNRRFTLPFAFSARLSLIDPDAIRPGALVRGRDVATLEEPVIHDNFEGLAITREGPATILWIVSDDNQFPLQRSLLLKFRWDMDAK